MQKKPDYHGRWQKGPVQMLLKWVLRCLHLSMCVILSLFGSLPSFPGIKEKKMPRHTNICIFLLISETGSILHFPLLATFPRKSKSLLTCMLAFFRYILSSFVILFVIFTKNNCTGAHPRIFFAAWAPGVLGGKRRVLTCSARWMMRWGNQALPETWSLMWPN